MIPEWILDLALLCLGLALVITAVRAFRGPLLPDRAIAADLIFFGMIGIITLIALRVEAEALFDIILITTLLGFMAAISMSRLGTGGRR